MRNPYRLYELYKKVYNFHSEYPDIRFMQLLNIFFNWYKNRYNDDGFFIEDDVFLERFEEFTKDIKGRDRK